MSCIVSSVNDLLAPWITGMEGLEHLDSASNVQLFLIIQLYIDNSLAQFYDSRSLNMASHQGFPWVKNVIFPAFTSEL